MILVVNVCKEQLHYYEFVAPVLKILSSMSEDYFICNYDEVSSDFLEKSNKVIICGTSLQDNEYLEEIEKFDWIRNYSKPIFGICAGLQVIQLVFGGEIGRVKEVGSVDVEFTKNFLGAIGKRKVYSLHQNIVNSLKFEEYGSSALCGHAFKHKEKEIYGTLFHPEVYNQDIIENFLRLKS